MSMGNGEGSDRLVAGRYRLLTRLGRGGMGTVWRAEDELLNRQVAVKEVHLRGEHSAAEREQQRERTLREARAVAQVRHPSVVGIHDVVEQDGRPWIVMELVDGATLGSVLAAEGPLPPREAAAIGLAVLAALEAAHARGVLHRDVKPDNVLLERGSGRIVLTDFGIARLDGSTTLTEQGAFLGSPEFTAPERTEGGTAGPEADLWSVGVLLCAALDGRSPFRRDSMSGVLYAVLYEDITLPARAEPLAPVIRGLLQRDPAGRLTAVEASWLLTDYLDGQPERSAATAETVQAPRRERDRDQDRDRDRDRQVASQDRGGTLADPEGAVGRSAEPGHGRVAPRPGADPSVAPRSGSASGSASGSEPASGSDVWSESGPDGAPERGRGRTALVLLAVVVVAAALAAGGVLLLGPDSGPGSDPGRGTVAGASTHPPASPAASSSASATTSAAPTGTPSVRPTALADDPVPAGYTLHRDPAGFWLAAPTGWPRTTNSAGQVFYISPDGRFRIGVHPSPGVSPDGVLATLKGQDSAGAKVYPGFRNDSVQATVFHSTSDAALMVWTWDGYSDGFGARTVEDQSWTEGGATYDFWVSAPTTGAEQAIRYFQVVSSTFRAG
ncbi:serine/threonine-protein kinase [Streptacidiphilus cavernicola]|uniref:non-specific serine/threonine protein kinase n=1 Tax=Streptacidiphilus cavernicola TaxID=3342716 RepID=A0ABV6W0T4_9ACTN